VVASNEAGRVDTKAYDIHAIKEETLGQGMVSITFDDGWQSIADKAAPILDAYGYATTQYIVTDAATKNVGDYMNLDTIRKLKDAGHEIASHTTKHCDLTQLSSDSVERQVHDSKTVLEKADLGPIKSLAYPYGQYDGRVDAITSKYYPLMRSSEDGYNGRYFDNRNIRAMAVHSTTTDKEFQSWVDHAERHKLWLVIIYHRVDEQGDYSVTSKQLTQQLDMIKNSRLKVLPLAKAADTIRAD
jgi:peptidoglycan/xylan/chitin deacetylase (PgdA/CDA1 family)